MKKPLPVNLLFGVFFVLNLSTVYAQKPGSYSSLYFDGSNDHVLIQDDTSLNPRDEITVEAWIKADSFGKNIFDNSVFCKHGWAAGNKGYVLRVGAGGGVSFNVSGRAAGGAWQEANTSTAVLKAGTWYHLAGTFDGDSVNVYVNGELVATKLYSGQIDISSGLNPKIGELAYGSGRRFKGEIDEVRVWSRALSDQQIRQYMCQKITTAHPRYSYLVGYWKLDENSGTNADDHSTRGNDGSLRNGPLWSVSGVPLGDTSVVIHGSTTIALASGEKDVLEVSTKFSTAGWIHIYLNNDTSINGADPASYVILDSTHYFGVFATSSYNVSLLYGNHAINGTSDECGIDLLVKESGGGGAWAGKNAAFFPAQDSLVLTGMRSAEYMLGIYPLDTTASLASANGLNYYCSNDSLLLKASGNNTFKYRWYRNDTLLPDDSLSTLWVSRTGTYEADIERSSNCKIRSNQLTISMRTAPTASLGPINGVCEDVDTLALTMGIPGGGEFLFKGIVNDSLVLPSRLGAGRYEIVYQYTDSNLCADRDTQTLEIWALPKVFISGNIGLCNNLDTVPLTQGQPTGGDYTGPGITDNNFIPSKVGRAAGKYPFTYGYTDSNQCYNEVKDSITVFGFNKATLFPIPEQCENNKPVALTVFPKGGLLQGPGVSGTSFDPAVAGAGIITLTYTFTNTNGCVDTDTQDIVVHKNTSLTWNYSLTTCINADPVRITEGTPSGGYFSGPGITDSLHFQAAIAGKGIHDILYVYVDSNTCKNTASAKVTVNDTTGLTVNGPGNICLNDKLILNHVTPSGGLYSGPGVSGNELSPWLVDTGNIRLKYEYVSMGCTSHAVIDGYIVPEAIVKLDFPAPLCSDMDPVRLKANPPGGTYSGKGVINDLFSPQFAGVGNHKVTYIYTDTNGCKTSVSDTVTVDEAPNAMAKDYLSVCANDTGFDLATGTPSPGQGYYYRYGTDTVIRVEPGTWGQGTYKVWFVVHTVTAGCKDSASTSLVVHPVPDKPVITRAGNTLISSSNSGNQWFDTQGPVAGANAREFEPTVNGAYYVIVTSDSGCSAMSDTFNFNLVSVQHPSVDPIRVVPNPSDGRVRILGLDAIDEVKVFDLYGKQVREAQMNGNELDLSNCADGVYELVCIAEGKTYSTRILIRR